MSDNPWDDYAPQAAAPAAAPIAPPAATDGPWNDYAPAAAAPPTDGGNWNFGLEAANAGLLGGGKKLMAYIQSLKPGAPDDAYNQALEHYGLKQGDYEAVNPVASTVANVAGGAVPAVGASVAAAPLAAGGLIANAATQAGIGATLGGASGFINDPNDLKGALNQAEWGAGLGVASIPLGAAVGAGAKYIGGKLGDLGYGMTHGATLPSQSADSLITSLGRQGDTPASALGTVQGMGPGATLADSGPGGQEAATRLAARDPNVGPTMVGNLKARADQFGPRINSAVDAAAGPDVNAVQQMQQLKATTAANGAAAYNPIMNSGATVDVTPVRNAIAQARVDGAIAGTEETPISKALGKAQSYIVGNNPSALPITVAHAAQDQIDDMASSALRAGNNAEARALWGVRDNLLQQMPPEYNAARAQYASDKAVENAFQNGRSLLAPTVDGQVYDPDLLESRLATMSPPEKQAFQLGARKSLTDAMGQARTDAAGVKNTLANDNGYRVQKLQQVFGQQNISPLLQELDHQATMQGTNQQVYQGSKTALATAADKNIPTATPAPEFGGHGVGMMGGVIAGHELGGLPGALAGAAIGPAWSKLVAAPINAARQTAQDAQRMALAKALTGGPTPELAAALNARAGQSMGQVSGDRAKMLARALMVDPGVSREGRKYFPATSAP